jgi:hypothetical protein
MMSHHLQGLALDRAGFNAIGAKPIKFFYCFSVTSDPLTDGNIVIPFSKGTL